MSKKLAVPKATMPTFRADPAVKEVMEAEAASRPAPLSLAKVQLEAVQEYIFNHSLFTKHGITPPGRA